MITVTSELTEPAESRPSEGALKINVDLSPMSAPDLSDAPATNYENVEIARMLERAVRESKCVDMESLCIESGIKCWQVNADLVVLNSEGNLIEACSYALTAGLAHFKRPDVTLSEQKELIIVSLMSALYIIFKQQLINRDLLFIQHSFDAKHPIPLTLLHYPFCVKFCFFGDKCV